MANTRTDDTNVPDVSLANSQEHEAGSSAPYETLLSEIVAKIKDAPLLFVIAIAALIIGAVVLGARLGSSDLRFVITVIALLAVVVIAGYYASEGAKIVARKRRAEGQRKQPPVSQRQQKVEATEGATIDGTLQELPGATSQVISASGRETVVKDTMQSSISDASKEQG